MAALQRGLKSGRITGDVGDLDLSGVDTCDLEAAIALSDEKGCTFPETVHLRNTGMFVVRVRKLVVKDAWEAVGKELQVS
jgi:hypothetical protein